MQTTTNKTVMIVEDHRLFREAMALLLEAEPNIDAVAGAGSLSECRDVVMEGVDVAVVDLDLPDGDGTDLICWISSFFPHILVLALTAKLDPDRERAALRAGAEKTLAKTESGGRILGAVRELCEAKPAAMHGRELS